MSEPESTVSHAPTPPRRPADPLRRAASVAGFIAVIAGVQLAAGSKIDWARWRVSKAVNPALAEALAWWDGRLDLAERMHDTALDPASGRVYNVFPVLQSLIAFVLTAPLPGRADPSEVPAVAAWLAFAWPLPVVGYFVFLSLTGRVVWATFWTIVWLTGTPVLAMLHLGCDGGVYYLNHLLSQVGLLLIAGDLLGARRLWPALIGLAIAAWSRQLTIMFAAPILVAAWRERSGGGPPRRIALVVAVIAAIVAVPMALNAAKFGSPFETGYRAMYAGRDDPIAESVRRHGLFSASFVPRNSYYMFAELPSPRLDGWRLRWGVSTDGASIWATMPVLAVVWLAFRRWQSDPVAVALMAAGVAVMIAVLCYHSTGWVQPGFYRFALDFAPVWMAVGARSLGEGGLRRASVCCGVWSVLYFSTLLRS